MPGLTSPPFRPDPASPCLCGSGLNFAECCGSTLENRQPPVGVTVQHDVLSDRQCSKLCAIGESSRKEWVGTVDSQTGEVGGMEKDSRVTRQVVLGKQQAVFNKLVNKLWLSVVEPERNVRIEWFEQPVLLNYVKGGHYAAHADAEYFDEQQQLWQRQLDRDLSMLLYINDDFEGGGLKFSHFNFRYAPQVGDLVIFPSDHRYMHQAEKVTSGTRYCIVSWAAIEGSPRANADMPFNGIVPKRGWFGR